MPEEKDDGQINYVKEAAKWQYNAIAMAGAAAFALGSALAALEMQLPALARSVPIATGVVVLIGGALQMSGPWFAAGAFVAMTGVLFLKPSGPGNIFPIVMLFGGLLIAGSCLLGAWLGKEAAGRRR